jgi:hypothetical protein
MRLQTFIASAPSKNLPALSASSAQISPSGRRRQVKARPLSAIQVAFSFSAVFVSSAGPASMTRDPTRIEAQPRRGEGHAVVDADRGSPYVRNRRSKIGRTPSPFVDNRP